MHAERPSRGPFDGPSHPSGGAEAPHAEVARLQAELARTRAELAEARRESLSRAELAHELARQARLMDRIIANAPAGIAFLDSNIVFRKVNQRLAEFLGLEVADMLDRSMFEVLPETRTYYGPLMERILETGEAFTARESPFVYMLNGVERTTYWDFTYMPLYQEDGHAEGILVLNIEVSERVRRERLLSEQIQRLKGLDQLKADFLNAASHELRTPLTSIKGYTEFLEDGLGGRLTAEQRGFVKEIQAGTQRLQRIVDDMLDFARLEAGTFQIQPLRADLAKIVAGEVASLAPQAQAKGIEIATVLPEPGTLLLTADPLRIGQVLLNLVGNAIKFTPVGGRVEVSACAEGDRLRVDVRDNGIGIATEHHEKVFEKFFQVNPTSTREHGGAGLGLSIARALVEAHRGSLHLASRPGEGSNFWFTLPRS